MGDSDIYRGEMRLETPLNSALCKIWYRLWQITGFETPGGGTPGGGTPVTVTSTAPTSGGSVTAGSKGASFVTSADFVGTINGATFPASASKNINPPLGYVNPIIPYTVSAGTLYIDVMT